MMMEGNLSEERKYDRSSEMSEEVYRRQKRSVGVTKNGKDNSTGGKLAAVDQLVLLLSSLSMAWHIMCSQAAGGLLVG